MNKLITLAITLTAMLLAPQVGSAQQANDARPSQPKAARPSLVRNASGDITHLTIRKQLPRSKRAGAQERQLQTAVLENARRRAAAKTRKEDATN